MELKTLLDNIEKAQEETKEIRKDLDKEKYKKAIKHLGKFIRIDTKEIKEIKDEHEKGKLLQNAVTTLNEAKRALEDKSNLEQHLKSIENSLPSNYSWILKVKEKVEKAQDTIDSQKMNIRVENSTNLYHLFTKYALPSEQIAIADIDFSGIKDKVNYSFELRNLLNRAVDSLMKYVEDSYETNVNLYKGLYKLFKDRKKALRAFAIGYAWIFGRNKLNLKDFERNSIINGEIQGSYEEFKEMALKDGNEKFLKTIKNDKKLEEELELAYHFFKVGVEYLELRDMYYEVNTTLKAIEDDWESIADSGDKKIIEETKDLFDSFRYFITPNELEDIKKFRENPEILLKDPKKYFMIFSRIHMRMFGPNLGADKKSLQHTYDIILIFDSSIISNPETHKQNIWADINFDNTPEQLEKGLLGIVCIPSNKAFYNEVIDNMIKFTEENPQLRVPVFDKHFKRRWPS